MYGVIEVKSRLSKAELNNASSQIMLFKQLPLEAMAFEQQGNTTHILNPAKPFGLIFAYELSDNSLGSICSNLKDLWNPDDPSSFINMVAVLGAGVITMAEYSGDMKHKRRILNSDSLGIHSVENNLALEWEGTGGNTIGRFFA